MSWSATHAAQQVYPKVPCPHCGKPLNSTLGQGVAAPEDFSICWECRGILRFNADLTLRASSEAEAEAEGVLDEIRDALRKVGRR